MSFIGAIILISIIGRAMGGESENATTTTNGDTKVTEKIETIYKIGDVIKDDQLEITVSKVEGKEKVGDQYISRKHLQVEHS